MSPALTHYAAKPVTKVRSKKQERGPSHKPIGLWVSIDANGEGWADWCRAEDFRLDKLECVHDVRLADGANVLTIRGSDELDAFAEQYAEVPEWSRSLSHPTYYIRWDRVAADYQGIIITPYIWSRRLDGSERTRWYYSWDCASGCIWDARAVASIAVRQQMAVAS